jgi:hypothetical protein
MNDKNSLQEFEAYLGTFRPASVRRPVRHRAMRRLLAVACAAGLAVVVWLAVTGPQDPALPDPPKDIAHIEPAPPTWPKERVAPVPVANLMVSRSLIGDEEKLFAYLEAPEDFEVAESGPSGAWFDVVVSWSHY